MNLPERSAFVAAEEAAAAQSRCCIVMTTTDSEAAAEALAAGLVEARLAACVQIVPIKSIYRWRGEVQREGEWLLLVKTASARFGEIERFVRPRHSYETPELTMLEIGGGSGDYLNWVAETIGMRT